MSFIRYSFGVRFVLINTDRHVGQQPLTVFSLSEQYPNTNFLPQLGQKIERTFVLNVIQQLSSFPYTNEFCIWKTVLKGLGNPVSQ